MGTLSEALLAQAIGASREARLAAYCRGSTCPLA